MFAVLIYLLEKHMGENCHITLSQSSLIEELKQAGFHQKAIGKAFHWLQALKQAEISLEQDKLLHCKAERVFSEFEYHRLDWTCLGFILFLQRLEILNPITRELVLDCLLSLQEEKLTIADVKWVVLIVLFNQPGEKNAL